MGIDVVVWIVCAASIAGVLIRPRGTPEWPWAVGGAALLVIFGLVRPGDAGRAVAAGTGVYLFLGGMMLLAGLARRENVFDWVASHAVRAARGSRTRLFALVYGVGIVVTIVLSNDATAVVLTPAVAAAVRKARADPLPHLFACAMIANAASFVLPISNPANLVVFANTMPALPQWLATFALPSLAAISATYVALFAVSRDALRGEMQRDVAVAPLGRSGSLALGGIGVTALVLAAASALRAPLGATTAVCGATIVAIAALRDRGALRDVARSVSWSVLALVAGLFVLVRGLENTGLLRVLERAAEILAHRPELGGVLTAAASTALVSNLTNNLPSGLLAGTAVGSLHGNAALHAAVAIGIDLGPNLSVTGSLATVLWLVALRRERIDLPAGAFLRTGAIVMPPALILASLAILATTR